MDRCARLLRQLLMIGAVLVGAVHCRAARAGDTPPMPLTPQEAAAKVNEQVTVEMEVKSATLRGDTCFLNSEANFKDDKNLTLFVGKDALAKFKEKGVDDPAAKFKGKLVQVTGKVILYKGHPEIVITGPEAIAVVDKQP